MQHKSQVGLLIICLEGKGLRFYIQLRVVFVGPFTTMSVISMGSELVIENECHGEAVCVFVWWPCLECLPACPPALLAAGAAAELRPPPSTSSCHCAVSWLHTHDQHTLTLHKAICVCVCFVRLLLWTVVDWLLYLEVQLSLCSTVEWNVPPVLCVSGNLA